MLGKLARFRRIAAELRGFEFDRLHLPYSNFLKATFYNHSAIGFPCESAAWNPSIDPIVGTKSVESMGRS